jgi:hypothetical protein
VTSEEWREWFDEHVFGPSREYMQGLINDLAAAEDRCKALGDTVVRLHEGSEDDCRRIDSLEAECNRLREAVQEALMLLGETMASPQKISAVKKAVAVALAAVKEPPRE